MKKLKLALLVLLLAVTEALWAQAGLYVLNPQNNWYWQPARIEQATLSVQPAGTYFEMGFYLTFSSAGSGFSGDVQLETLMQFTLPEGSMILDSWLWVGDNIVQGRIIDKWTASSIYEGIVDRRRDPSILMKNGGDSYELRVYPMKPGEHRKVKITYLVPAAWSNGRAIVPLPSHILRASTVTPALHTLVWLKEGWVNPAIPEMSGVDFNEFYDEEFGQYYRLDIPDHELEKTLSLRLEAPITNGLYLSTVTDSKGDQFYQLAMDFSQYIEREESTKVALLVDYEPGNSTLERQQVFESLKAYLLDNYSSSDSFNLFYSRYEIERYSDQWSPMTVEAIDEAFLPLLEGKTLYSNLPGLIAQGNHFAHENQGGNLFIFSNADNYGTAEKANPLLKDIQDMDIGPVYIADFQNMNWDYHRIGSLYYTGQEYFFQNLARITGGEYQRMNYNYSMLALLTDVFGSLAGSINAFDLYTTAQDGFCYARYNQNDKESLHLGEYFVQTGRYLGDLPFSLSITGLYNGEPFNQLIQVSESQIAAGDSLLSKSWYGQHIRDLEWSEYSNEQVNMIVAESIEQRILSRYTAFLCLEPSDTVPVCTSCQDESRLTGILDFNQEVNDSLKVFPNPCSEQVTITFTPSDDWDADHTRIEVFNVLGAKVWDHQPVWMAGREYSIQWNLKGNDGIALKPGVYFVTIKSQQTVYRKTLIIK